jgi:hypothetical protein
MQKGFHTGTNKVLYLAENSSIRKYKSSTCFNYMTVTVYADFLEDFHHWTYGYIREVKDSRVVQLLSC